MGPLRHADRRFRPRSGLEAMQQLLGDEGSEPRPESDGVRLTPRERFYAHVIVYLIGCFNLAAINVARTPGTWWFWIPIAVWTVVLAGHLLWVLVKKRIRPEK